MAGRVRAGRRSAVLGLAALAVAAWAAGCGARSNPARPGGSKGPVRIVVSIAPLKGLVGELARELGEDVTIDTVVPVGALEHGFEVPPSMVQKLVQADVVVYVGLGLEPQVEKVLREAKAYRRVVCFADVVGIEDAGHSHDHEHGHNHDHGHDGADPHLWLDPSLVAKLVPAVRDALAGVATDLGRSVPAERLRAPDGPAARLLAHVGEIDAMYEERLRPARGGVMVTAHEAWGRLAARYGLEQAPLAGLEATEPSPAAIARAAELVRARKARAIFSEPQINGATVQRVAQAAGAKVLQLDPLGNGDWFEMMENNLRALVEGLTPEK
jgi:zinc transport system substrate-binding protein